MRDLATEILTAPSGAVCLFSIGQAGFVVKSGGGQLLGIDLYLSECVERHDGVMGFKRLMPRLLGPFDLEFDYLIATHPHLDHFDVDSMPEMMSNRRTELFASLNCESEAHRLHMESERIHYVRPGDKFAAGNFQLNFVNCDHGAAAPDAVGVVITVDGKRIYEAGDTCLRLDRVSEYLAFGPIDVLIAPINGAFGNMDEEGCARFSAALNPGLTIPCHYGMFAAHGGNPGKFLEAMRAECPGNRVLLMAQGERLRLN